MQKQRSVARILGAVVGSLGIVLALICAYGLKQGVSRYVDSNRIVSLAVASRDLTNALVAFRLERGDTISHLSSASAAADNVLALIAENRATATKNYAQALQSIAQLERAGFAERMEKLRGICAQLEDLRPRTTAGLRQEKAAGEANLTAGWVRTSDAYMDAIGEITAYVDGAMTLIDPVVDRLVLVKQSSWQARVSLGQTILMQFSSILAGKNWGPAEGIDFADQRGRVQQSWKIVRDLSTNVANAALQQAIRDAEPAISGALHEERNAIMTHLLKGEPAGVAGIDYRDRQLVGADKIVTVTKSALANMIARAEEGAAEARLGLILYGLLLPASLALMMGGMLLVRNRVTVPLVAITSVMTRFADRDFAEEVPGLDRNDEIGRMAAALQVFKEAMSQRRAALGRSGRRTRGQGDACGRARQPREAVRKPDRPDGADALRRVERARDERALDVGHRDGSAGPGRFGLEPRRPGWRWRADRGVGSRRPQSRPPRDQSPGRAGDARDRAGGEYRQGDQHHRAGARYRRGPHWRGNRAHHLDRRSDQSVGAQCDHRSGARRRVRQGLRRGGERGEESGLADCQGDRRDQQPDPPDPGCDAEDGLCDRRHRQNHRGGLEHQPRHRVRRG